MNTTRHEDLYVEAGPGGVMTDEVGVVTGELDIVTEPLPDGRATVRVRYSEADEWYVMTGAPVPVPPEGGLAALHAEVLRRVRAGGAAEVPR